MLTVVTCARADDRSPFSVLSRFLFWNQAMLPEAQFIIVEWGDPTGCWPPLWEVLGDFERLYVITVPQDVVDEHEADGVFAEYTAKNVGLWRAEPGMVLSTNIDCYIPDELAEQIRNCSSSRAVYRAPRWDFANAEALALVSFTKRHHPDSAAGDFTMMSRDAWCELQGYLEIPGQRPHIDSEMIDHAKRRGYKIKHLSPVWHRAHEQDGWRDRKVSLPGHPRPKQPNWGLQGESFRPTGAP